MTPKKASNLYNLTKVDFGKSSHILWKEAIDLVLSGAIWQGMIIHLH